MNINENYQYTNTQLGRERISGLQMRISRYDLTFQELELILEVSFLDFCCVFYKAFVTQRF